MKQKELDIIFAKAKCEVWKERVRNEECSLGEFTEALSQSSGESK